VTQRSPQVFHHQTDQRIRSGVREHNPIETHAEVEMKTQERNRLSENGQIPKQPA
jgi:hypothetical protein